MKHPLLASYLCAWHPQRPQLAVGAPDGLTIIGPQRAARRLTGPLSLNALAWGEGGRLAFSEERVDAGVCLLDDDGDQLLRWQPEVDRVDELVFSEDGARLVALGEGAAALDLQTGRTLWRRERVDRATQAHLAGRRHGARFTTSVAMPDTAAWCGPRVLLVYDDTYEVLDGLEGALLAEGSHERAGFIGWREGALAHGALPLDDPFARSHSHSYSADGCFAAAEGRGHQVWVQDQRPLRAIPGHPRTLTALAWSPGGQLLTGCRDGAVRQLIGERFEAIAELDDPTEAISWSADGAWMAFAGRRSVTLSPGPGR